MNKGTGEEEETVDSHEHPPVASTHICKAVLM